ncbi:hypothetical protein DIE19_34665 [Burkholderia sp. Bp9126]|nr:hypothetical protein DIE19_34665 [Burkholderia sp. Bp9126]
MDVTKIWSRSLVRRDPQPSEEVTYVEEVHAGKEEAALSDAEVTHGCEVMYLLLKSGLVAQWGEWRERQEAWRASAGQAERIIPPWAGGWRPQNVEYAREAGRDVAVRGDIQRCAVENTTPADVNTMLELTGIYLRWMDLDLEEHAMDFKWLRAALALDLTGWWEGARQPQREFDNALLARYAEVDESRWGEYEADVECGNTLRLQYQRDQMTDSAAGGSPPPGLNRRNRQFGASANWKGAMLFGLMQIVRPHVPQIYAGSAGSEYTSSSGMARLFNAWLNQGGRTADSGSFAGGTFGAEGGPTAAMRERAYLFKRDGGGVYREAFLDLFRKDKPHVPSEPIRAPESPRVSESARDDGPHWTPAEEIMAEPDDDRGEAPAASSSAAAPTSREVGFLDAAQRLMHGQPYEPDGSFGLPGAHGFGARIRIPLSGGGHTRSATLAPGAEQREINATSVTTEELETAVRVQSARLNRAYQVSVDMVTASKAILNEILNGTGATADTVVKVTVKKFFDTVDFSSDQNGEVEMTLLDIAQGALQRKYGVNYAFEVDLPSHQDLFRLPSRIFSGGFPITDKIEKALEARIQWLEQPESVAARTHVLLDTIRARVVTCLDERECNGDIEALRQALVDFIEGRQDASLMTFCGELVSGVFAIPVAGDRGGMWLFNTARSGSFWMPRDAQFDISDSFVPWFSPNIPLSSYLEHGNKKENYEVSGIPYNLAYRFLNRNVGRRLIIGYLYGFIPASRTGTAGMKNLARQLAELETQKARADFHTLLHTSSDTWKQFAAQFGKSVLEGWSHALTVAAMAPGALGSKTATLWASLGTSVGTTGVNSILTDMQDNPGMRDAMQKETLIGALLSAAGDTFSAAALLKKLKRVKDFLADHAEQLSGWGTKIVSELEAPTVIGTKGYGITREYMPGQSVDPDSAVAPPVRITHIDQSMGLARKGAIEMAENAIDALKISHYRRAAERVMETLFDRHGDESLRTNLIEDLSRIAKALKGMVMVRGIRADAGEIDDQTALKLNDVMRRERRIVEISEGAWKGAYEVEQQNFPSVLFDVMTHVELRLADAVYVGFVNANVQTGANADAFHVYEISLSEGNPRPLAGPYNANRLSQAAQLLARLREHGWLGSIRVDDDGGESSESLVSYNKPRQYLVACDARTGAIHWIAKPYDGESILIRGLDRLPLTESLVKSAVSTLGYGDNIMPEQVTKLCSTEIEFSHLGIIPFDQLGLGGDTVPTDESSSLEYRLLRKAIRRGEEHRPTSASELLMNLRNINNLAHSFIGQFPDSSRVDATRELQVQVKARILHVESRIRLMCETPTDSKLADECNTLRDH